MQKNLICFSFKQVTTMERFHSLQRQAWGGLFHQMSKKLIREFYMFNQI